jgi:hypothetical protein
MGAEGCGQRYRSINRGPHRALGWDVYQNVLDHVGLSNARDSVIWNKRFVDLNQEPGSVAPYSKFSAAETSKAMTSFDQRENAYEVEFAHQQELRFKIRERAVKLLALRAAERLGKTGQAGEACAVEMVAVDVASPSPTRCLGILCQTYLGGSANRMSTGRWTGSGHKRMHQYAAPLEADES